MAVAVAVAVAVVVADVGVCENAPEVDNFPERSTRFMAPIALVALVAPPILVRLEVVDLTDDVKSALFDDAYDVGGGGSGGGSGCGGGW